LSLALLYRVVHILLLLAVDDKVTFSIRMTFGTTAWTEQLAVEKAEK